MADIDREKHNKDMEKRYLGLSKDELKNIKFQLDRLMMLEKEGGEIVWVEGQENDGTLPAEYLPDELEFIRKRIKDSK